MDCFTCDGAVSPRYGVWTFSSWTNERHMLFAWVSLVRVTFTHFYINLVASGTVAYLTTW